MLTPVRRAKKSHGSATPQPFSCESDDGQLTDKQWCLIGKWIIAKTNKCVLRQIKKGKKLNAICIPLTVLVKSFLTVHPRITFSSKTVLRWTWMYLWRATVPRHMVWIMVAAAISRLCLKACTIFFAKHLLVRHWQIAATKFCKHAREKC